MSSSQKGPLGFGEHESVAIDLIKTTVSLLDNLKIINTLISGTLLGYVRHNGFIPWDDDIDMLVEKSLLAHLSSLRENNPNISFICADYNTYIKVAFKDRGFQIDGEFGVKYDHDLKIDVPNYWPFIDLFLYEKSSQNKIKFFNKEWLANQFFPLKKTNFMGVDVSVPRRPNYFLKLNYGNYMKPIDKGYSHKHEHYSDVVERAINLQTFHNGIPNEGNNLYQSE